MNVRFAELVDPKKISDLVGAFQVLAGIDALPFPMFSVDAAGRLTACNRAFAEAFGSSGFPPQAAEIKERCRRHLAGGGGAVTFEAPLAFGDGGIRPVTVVLASFADESGGAAGLVGTLVELAQRRGLDQSAQGDAPSLGGLAAELAHDISQPLFAMRLVLEMASLQLEDGQFGRGDWQAALAKISENVERMVEVAEHLRRFARREPEGAAPAPDGVS